MLNLTSPCLQALSILSLILPAPGAPQAPAAGQEPAGGLEPGALEASRRNQSLGSKQRARAAQIARIRSLQAQRAAMGSRQGLDRLALAVRTHQVRLARMERLAEIFSASGAAAKVQRVAAVRAKELSRHARVLSGARKELGDRGFDRVMTHLGQKTIDGHASRD